MWRVVWQRLGAGYVLLLPALIAIGLAMDASVQAFCYHMHHVLEDVTGRGISSLQGCLRVLEWCWNNTSSLVFAAVLPWWIGAWVLLRPKEALSFPRYLQVVFGVICTVIAEIAFLLWCAATVIRKLQLWSTATPGNLIFGMLVILLVFVVLVFASASRNTNRESNLP